MEKKTAVKLDGTKETVKAAGEKVVAKAEEVKAAVKETATKAKTTKGTKTAKKEELKPEVFIQYQGREAVVAEAVEKAKAQFVAEGHRASSIKSLQIYLKPEEYAAYYVVNKKFAGRVDLF